MGEKNTTPDSETGPPLAVAEQMAQRPRAIDLTSPASPEIVPPELTPNDYVARDMAGLPLDALCRVARALFKTDAAVIECPRIPMRWLDADEPIRPALKALPFASAHDASAYDAPDMRAALDAAGLHCVASQPLAPFLHTCSQPSSPQSPADLEAAVLAQSRLVLFANAQRMLQPAEVSLLEDMARAAALSLCLHEEARYARLRENDFRLLAETSTDTIVRGTLDGIRLYVNPACRNLLGYEPEELIGRRAIEITHPDDIPAMRDMMQRVAQGEEDIGILELRQRHADGSWIWMEACLRLTRDPASGAPTGYVTSVRGIGARKEAEARLEHLSLHDVLTGLANRAMLGRALDEAVARHQRTGARFALFYMDIDHFKQVNDTYGHHTGDAVLCETARRLRATLRPDDMIARLGGDEFAVLLALPLPTPLDGTAQSSWQEHTRLDHVARRLLEAMRPPIRQEEKNNASLGHLFELHIGLSIGIATAPECGLDADQLLCAADKALYEAKQAGRNTFRFAPPSADPPATPLP